jgi:hypothetical protein
MVERARVALKTIGVGEIDSTDERHLVAISQVIGESRESCPF